MNGVLLNFSGHALSDATLGELGLPSGSIETIPFDEIKLEEPVEPQLRAILEQVNAPLDGSVPIAIIPPGQSVFAILLVVYLNGLLGHPPTLCLLQPNELGEYAPANMFYVDSKALRTRGRAFRQDILRRSARSPIR